MFGRPGSAIDEKRLAPRFTVQRPGCNYRDRKHPRRRITRARVHDMAVNPAFGPEKLFVTARGGKRHVLQVIRFHRLPLIPWIADFDLPAPRFIRRGTHSINTAARTCYQGTLNPVSLQDLS